MTSNYFDIGLRASRRYIVDEEPGYICPTCLRIVRYVAELSKEHVPPRSLGGQVLCLTCKSCNNESGHTIDAAMHERADMSQIMRKGTSSKYVQLKIDDATVNASITRTGMHADFVVSPDHNDPVKTREFMSKTPHLGQGKKLQVWYRNEHSERRALVGYLRAAYLYLFAKLGYAYILRESLDPVRSQIANPDEEKIWKWRLRRKENVERQMIYFCDNPINCSIVAIKEHLIVMPSIDDSSDPYEHLSQLTKDTEEDEYIGKMHFTHSLLPPTQMELLVDQRITGGSV